MQKQALGTSPGFAAWVVRIELTILYSEWGRVEDAKAGAAELLRILPHFSVKVWGKRNLNRNTAQIERDKSALRKAGLK